MSNNHDRRSRDYSKYDSMSTEQLQEILRLDAHQTDGEGMDTEELFYVMEVLTVRRKSNPETAGKSLQKAKAEFRKHYMPEETPKTVAFPMWLHRAATVAAVLAIFMVITTSVNAFGYDLWGKVATWSQDFFHFEDETQGTETPDPDTQYEIEYSSLQEALDRHEIAQSLAPTWFPDGYSLADLKVFKSPREISISAKYERSDEEIRISIRRLVGSNPEEIEKSENYIQAYDANGITYYLFSNYEKVKAAWVVGEFECYITGILTIDELKAIIDSIYKRRLLYGSYTSSNTL